MKELALIIWNLPAHEFALYAGMAIIIIYGGLQHIKEFHTRIRRKMNGG